MAIYYAITFGILVAEMVIFGILVLPFPSHWRRAIFKFVSQSPISAKAMHLLKIVFAFILVLFIDTVNRLQRIEQEASSEQNQHADYGYQVNQKSKKFYTQRNMYLTGFTLFLSLILERTSSLIIQVLKREEELEVLRNETRSTTDSQQSVIESEDAYKKEIAALVKELKEIKQKERDFETLKKQVAQQTAEYNRLADERNSLQSTKSETKKDV